MATISVENPATGETIREVPAVAPEEVAELVARARAARLGGARVRGARQDPAPDPQVAR
jgi:acyl-CoA reductase-like NAD-dependent aldehyde dehydrogenase